MMSGFGHILDSPLGCLVAATLNPTVTLGKGGMTWWKEGNVDLGLFINAEVIREIIMWMLKEEYLQTVHSVHLPNFKLLTDS